MRYSGARPVVVHDAGPEQVRRAPDEDEGAALRRMAAGLVQRRLVGLVNAHGPLAVGITGEDGHTLTRTASGDLVADPGVLRTLLDDGRIPVVAAVARGEAGVHRADPVTAARLFAAELPACRPAAAPGSGASRGHGGETDRHGRAACAAADAVRAGGVGGERRPRRGHQPGATAGRSPGPRTGRAGRCRSAATSARVTIHMVGRGHGAGVDEQGDRRGPGSRGGRCAELRGRTRPRRSCGPYDGRKLTVMTPHATRPAIATVGPVANSASRGSRRSTATPP
ncbi:hypothetical protein ABZV75_09870 [Streptomyces flaveolus]|uniref:hypothetical protein n=1 Tax=Streptomyces flaveolus TaxID=67297 RepID=UPI0033A70D9B